MEKNPEQIVAEEMAKSEKKAKKIQQIIIPNLFGKITVITDEYKEKQINNFKSK